MNATFELTKIKDDLSALGKAMRALTEQDVFIGIPEDNAARKAGGSASAGDTGISNAYLAYIHEHGVPEKNIPARPALIPGIEDIQEEAAAILEHAAKKALEGNEGAVETGLNKIGALGQNAVRARFVNNAWQPLADSTLDARQKTSESVNKKGETVRKYGKSRRERGAVNPLIDTSQMRKAYTYVIRKKGNSALVVK